ncbi:MAG: Gfo/Idh/MocA family oxidoreductase [Brachybacterium sp.]|nr:Gfo/Idh/MocA family oxidoreductase [Brachybacterium sp.]
MTTTGIAVLSAWHVHAEEYARAAHDNPHAEVSVLWDDDRERGSALAETLGVPYDSDLDRVLAREEIHGVTVTTATTDHLAVIGAAIDAGKHVFTEKLLAPTVEECEELIDRARAAGITLTVSLPRLTHGYTSAIRRILDEGTLGQLTYTRIRLAHDGAVRDWLPARFYDPAAAIGGAFSDLAAHPVYLTQEILGTDLTVVGAAYTDLTGRGVEDNAVVTVTSPDGAIGSIETGFVTPASPFSIEIHGTAGSLQYGLGPDAAMLLDSGSGWAAVDAPADDPILVDTWIDHIRAGTPDVDTPARAIALTALVEQANRAASLTTSSEGSTR